MSEKNATTEQLFQRAYLFITEGNKENALVMLDGIQAESAEQKREVAYLRAWCCILDRHWDEAARFLFSPGVSEENIPDIRTLGQTERRRRAYYILVMGDVAVNLQRYEAAMRHYIQCIRFLDERRMNDTNLRIRALLGLGLTHTMTGYYSSAVEQYEEALRVCGNDPRHPRLPDIYYGLCDAHRHIGNLDRALEYGKQALQLYTEQANRRLICRVRNLLGRVYYQLGAYQDANASYTESLALATSINNPVMVLINYTALADLRLQEEKLEEAWRYCELALDYSANVSSDDYVGKMYIVCGNVALARKRTHEAIGYYEKAIEKLKASEGKSDVLSEAYSRLAQTLETSGRQDLALTYWRSAYAAHSGSEDSPLA